MKNEKNVQNNEGNAMQKALIFDIQRGSYVDGPGIRTTIFFKGCNLRCKWCHNPESQSAVPQLLFYQSKCSGCGKCKEICPHHLEKCDLCGKCELYCPKDARKICGKEYLTDEILREILKDKIFYGKDGGATFSGGECMLQIDFLEEILKLCRKNGIHTAVDTAGNVPWESFERILPDTDLFLYDVKCFSEELHKTGTGASNHLILDNLRKLSETKIKIHIRIPLIPSFNDSEEEFRQVARFLKSHGITDAEILPYHKMGEHKWVAAGMKPHSFEVPDTQTVDYYRSLLK